MNALEWLAPERLVLLAAPTAAWTWQAWRRRGRTASVPLAAWLSMADGLDLPRSWRQRLAAWPRWLGRAALLLLLLAAARPASRVEEVLPIAGLDVAICLDRSSSMAATDAGQPTSRIVVAQAALDELVARRPEDRFALVPFARWPDVRSPLTRDQAAIRAFLGAIDTVAPDSAEDASGIGAALLRAGQLLATSDAPARVIVLLTDGEENVASLETQDEIAPLHAAQWCARQGIRIHSIVAGADALDTRQVEAATQATGGRFFRARDSAAVAEVSRQLDTLEQARRRDTRTRHVEHGARLVAAAGAALVLAGMLVACGAAVAAGAWRRQRLATALRVAALAGVAAALAGPTAGREALLPTHRGDVVFALDVSRSMNAADVAPTRLGAARSELERLALSVRGERIALVPFAGAAALAVPLTSDGAAFAEQAAWCDPGAVERGGSDLGAALRVAGEALRAADSAGGAIVLLTDGEDLAASAIAEIPGLRARGIVVHAVGFGSPLGSRIERSVEEGGGFAVDGDGVPIVTALDERSLQTLCAATGGIYVAARDRASPLAELWRELPLVAADRRTQPEPRPLLPWLALAAAALLGLSSLAARKPVPLPLWLAGTLAAASCGEAPPPDLATPAWNAALSARREGDRATAEALGERAAAGDPARFEACVAFLRGLDAWERQEALSGADAIADCRTALAEWSLAARIEPDWPELRRDCERAALRLRQLEPTPVVDAPVVDERRKVAIEAPPAEIPESPPTEPVATAPEEDLATLTPLLTPLPTRALDELERTMAAREAEKREARLRERRAADAAVERDW